jgi:hypothetical protein
LAPLAPWPLVRGFLLREGTRLIHHLLGQDAGFLGTAKVMENRSASSAALKEAFRHPDLTMCGYCGTLSDDDGENLKSCKCCKLAKYCNVDCQTKHWKMKSSFGHKKVCHAVASG